jgi:hypothetical protein
MKRRYVVPSRVILYHLMPLIKHLACLLSPCPQHVPSSYERAIPLNFLRSLIVEAVLGRYNSSIYTNDPNLERIKVLQEIQHPQYDSRTKTHDMMLLKLEHAPHRKRNKRYVRLNSDMSILTENDREITGRQAPKGLRTIGWGHTEARNGEPSELLQQAKLNFVPNGECSEADDGSLSYSGRIFEDMMCTFAHNTDSCYGEWTNLRYHLN